MRLKKGLGCALFSLLFVVKTATAFDLKVVTENWPPYNYQLNGEVAGLGSEIVTSVLTKAKIPVNIAIYPWARAYLMATQEPDILIYTIGRTPERENLFKWVGKIAPRKMYLFKLKSRKDISLHSLDDARRYTIGLVRNSASHLSLKSQGFENNGKLALVIEDVQNLKMLLSGRIELMAGNELALAYMARMHNLQYSNLERCILLSDKGHYYFALSKKTDQHVYVALTEAYEVLEKTGELDRIRAKYQ